MEDDKQPVLDWSTPPPGAVETSLWPCLHDAELVCLTSDRLKRTSQLEFSIPYLIKFHRLPDNLHFVLVLSSVTSARVIQSFPWPGEFAVPQGASYEEQEKLIADYWSKWREESISWSEFESKFSTDPWTAEVSNADYLIGEDGKFALRLQLMVDGNTYCELTLRAETVQVERSDGEPFSLTRLIHLGESYWEAFAAKRKVPHGDGTEQ